MASIVGFRHGLGEELLAQPAWRIFAIGLAGFAGLKLLTLFVASRAPELVPFWAVAVAVVAISFRGVRQDALPLFARRFLFASCAFLCLYFAVEPFDIPYAALGPDHVASRYHMAGRIIGIALALLGFWRPAFIWAAATHLLMQRGLQQTLTGFYFSTLDIENVAEVISFASGALVLALASVRPGRLQQRSGMTSADLGTAALIIIAAAIGAHLGNYFLSALAKLSLDGGVFSWILGNRLYEGLPTAIEKGTFPFAASPMLTQTIYDLMVKVGILLNLGSFGMQLFAPIATRRRRLLIGITVIYDLFHLVVWLSFGLLFWKWIALNTIILVTLAAMDDDLWDRTAANVSLVFTLFGWTLFTTATLAWYDAPGLPSPYFVLQMDDGERYRLPSAYFRSSSYQVSQGRMHWPGGSGHFQPAIWGSVLHWRDLQDIRGCHAPDMAEPVAPAFESRETIARFAAAHHKQMMGRLDGAGHASYYLLPHHHVPSPFVTDPVAKLDLRKASTYFFVMESVCLSLDKGHLKRKVIARTEFPLYDAKLDQLLVEPGT